MGNWLEKTKERWGVRSTWRFVVIMLVFALAGMAVTQVKGPVYHLFHFTSETSGWLKIPVYILVMFPIYQILLLSFAALFGEFKFFWEKEKKMGRWLARSFVPKPQPE